MSYHEGSNWQAKKEDEKKPLYEPNTPSGPERSVEEIAKEMYPTISMNYCTGPIDYQNKNGIQSKFREAFKAGFLAASSKGKKEEGWKQIAESNRDAYSELCKSVWANTERMKWLAKQLLMIRDCLVKNECDEAYHILYKIADPEMNSLTPWETLEKLVMPPAPQSKDTSGMQWIKSSERLPEYHADCFIKFHDGDNRWLQRVGYCNSAGEWFYDDDKPIHKSYQPYLEWLDESSPLLSTQQGERMFTLQDLKDVYNAGVADGIDVAESIERGESSEVDPKKYFKEKFNINL